MTKAEASNTYRVVQKIWHTFCTPYNFIKYWPIFTLFTVRIRGKFVIILSLTIPPHLICVATKQQLKTRHL